MQMSKGTVINLARRAANIEKHGEERLCPACDGTGQCGGYRLKRCPECGGCGLHHAKSGTAAPGCVLVGGRI